MKKYKQQMSHTEIGGDEVIGEDNYSFLPVVPLWGSGLRQSTLIGILTHLPNITPDEIDKIIENRSKDELRRFQDTTPKPEPDEDDDEDDEEDDEEDGDER